MHVRFPSAPILSASLISAGDRTRKYSLILCCCRAYSTALFSAVLPRLCLTGFTFAQPFMINTLTNWIQETDAPESSGKWMIGAYALVYLGLAVSAELVNAR